MKRFRILATVTAATTFVLMLLGAYVKAIHAGLACPSWPSCDPGQSGLAAWIPDFGAVPGFTAHQVFAEWIHRGVAVVVGLLILAVAVQAWRHHREHRGLVTGALVALGLLPVQVLMGGLTVTRKLEPLIVVGHQGFAVLIFGALTATAVLAWVHDPTAPPTPGAS